MRAIAGRIRRRFPLAPLLGLAALVSCAAAPPLERIAGAIATLEGWRDPDSLVRRLHNPGALVYVGQLGAAAGARGFARFEDDAAGWNALLVDLGRKRDRGLGTVGILEQWTADEGELLAYLAFFDDRGLLESAERRNTHAFQLEEADYSDHHARDRRLHELADRRPYALVRGGRRRGSDPEPDRIEEVALPLPRRRRPRRPAKVNSTPEVSTPTYLENPRSSRLYKHADNKPRRRDPRRSTFRKH